MLRSTDDLVDLLQTHEYCGYIGSLDVESLFTNVLVDDSINIIIETIYNNNNTNGIKLPKIPVKLLNELLNICTKDLIFRTPQGLLYQQINGVSMGSPLGPLFANFYMDHLENKILSNIQRLPICCARYFHSN